MLQPFKIMMICFCTLILWSCQKEYSYEGGGNTFPGNGSDSIVKSEWDFTASATLYHGPVDTAYLTKEGVFTVLTLTGKSAGGSEFITIKLKTADAAFRKGKTYKTYLDQAKFIYQNEIDTIYSAILYKGGDLYVTISAMDSNKVMATFIGQALDATGRSNEITLGHFSSPIKKGVQSNNGYVMLWANVLCNGSVNVNVNNQQGTIEKSFSSAPDCGETGAATYNLPAGSYQWAAYCGTDSLEGMIDVTAGACTKLLIDFPYRPAPITNTNQNCKLSEVSYQSTGALDSKLTNNNVVNIYTGARVSQLKYFVAPAPVIITHTISYSGDTVFIDGDNQYTKYFIVDSKGRVVLYHGSSNPTIFYPFPPEPIVKYSYDNQNQLIKRETFNPGNNNLVSTTLFIWNNGNIVSTIESSLASSQPIISNFQYYSKQVRAMPFLNSNGFELFFYQSLINFGNPCKNLLKQKIVQTTTIPAVYDYNSYIIDDNDYVLSCRITANTKHIDFQFNYQCF